MYSVFLIEAYPDLVSDLLLFLFVFFTSCSKVELAGLYWFVSCCFVDELCHSIFLRKLMFGVPRCQQVFVDQGLRKCCPKHCSKSNFRCILFLRIFLPCFSLRMRTFSVNKLHKGVLLEANWLKKIISRMNCCHINEKDNTYNIHKNFDYVKYTTTKQNRILLSSYLVFIYM